MPPKTQITRAQIEDAAFEIVRAEGVAALSARRIAQHLSCSTQPVYTACESMDAVRAAVLVRTLQLLEERYLASPERGEPPFLAMGFATLRFANEEPHLFALTSEELRGRLTEAPPPPVLAAMRADPELGALSHAQLVRVHSLLWVFSQGLAGLVPKGAPPAAMKRARDLLRHAGKAVVQYELSLAQK
jgi:AcrR family transcriptional regulator